MPALQPQEVSLAGPYALLSGPVSTIARWQLAEPQAGQPVLLAYTQEELAQHRQGLAEQLKALGMNLAVRVLLLQRAEEQGMELALLQGALEEAGTTVTVCPARNEDRVWQMIAALDVDVVYGAAEDLLRLGERRQQAVSQVSSPVQVLLCELQGATLEMRGHLEELWGATAVFLVGRDGWLPAGFACECTCRNGLHINEGLFYTEIAGEELLVTPLQRQAMPLLRLTAGQGYRFAASPCSCGRPTKRLILNGSKWQLARRTSLSSD